MKKGEKSYHLGSLFEREEVLDSTPEFEETEIQEPEEPDSAPTVSPENDPEETRHVKDKPEKKWYECIPTIDASGGLKNSGSEESFLMVLQIYTESGRERDEELSGYYEQEDWENYKIKVHALKSSSRLAGAMEIGDEAEKLEMAAKDGDIDYIREHHMPMMEKFRALQNTLSVKYGKEAGSEESNLTMNGAGSDEAEGEPEDKRPLADEYLMEGVYEMLREGATDENESLIADSFAEMAAYRIPSEESGLMEELRRSFEAGEYAGMIALLDKNGK